MKLLVTSIITILCLHSIAQVSKKNDRFNEDLKGGVKTAITYKYNASLGNGNVIKKVESTKTIKKRCAFNVAGNYTYLTNYSGGEISDSALYTYNTTGKITKYTIIEQGARTYVYDAKGFLIETKVSTPTGELINTSKFTNDAKGNCLTESITNADGSFDSKYTYKYDVNNNKIEQNWIKEDGSVSNTITWKYDAKNVLIENKDEIKNISTYAYNAKNQIIETISKNQSGEIISKTKYTYDAKGNLTDISYFKKDGTLQNQTIFAKYDNFGNYTVSYVLENGSIINYTERVLIY